MNPEVEQSKRIIGARIGALAPRTGLVLGSGLGDFVAAIDAPVIIDYDELPGFPRSGVSGHAGRLACGRVGGAEVAVLQGRAHYYEHGDPAAMKVAVRTLAALGCDRLILTNAAGSVDPDIGPGSVMLLTDHISFTGVSPLFDETGDDRFVDLVDAYDPDIRRAFRRHAAALGITLHEGVYMWFCGPHFETPAEIRAAGTLGASAVGMSTVPEVILARHAGLRVGALSIITNLAAGLGGGALSHERTMRNAAGAAQLATRLLCAWLGED